MYLVCRPGYDWSFYKLTCCSDHLVIRLRFLVSQATLHLISVVESCQLLAGRVISQLANAVETWQVTVLGCKDQRKS